MVTAAQPAPIIDILTLLAPIEAFASSNASWFESRMARDPSIGSWLPDCWKQAGFRRVLF
ncbi:hypothetical protein Pr1d_41660 [Bythopirellula goksoeyrii]|uniref:Uncharacterized protein n=1 Tax=Bythopirellula goksoeyrii TaxID=1400387 RepID=A0A5B9QGZ2_9BACT|nr:hypothetical protein Pr1d_41660 [Bythopirellula goksoeyrii]